MEFHFEEKKPLTLTTAVPTLPTSSKEEEKLRKWLGKFIRGEYTKVLPLENFEQNTTEHTKLQDQYTRLERYFNEYLHLIVQGGTHHSEPIKDLPSVLSFTKQLAGLELTLEQTGGATAERIEQLLTRKRHEHEKLSFMREYHTYWDQTHMKENELKTLHTRDTFMAHLITMCDALGSENLDLDEGLSSLSSLFDLVYFNDDQENKAPSTMDHVWSNTLFLGYEIFFRRFFDNLLNNIYTLKNSTELGDKERILNLLTSIAEQQVQISKLQDISAILEKSIEVLTTEIALGNENEKRKATAQLERKEVVYQEHEKNILAEWKKYIFFCHDLSGVFTRIMSEGSKREKEIVQNFFSNSVGFTGLQLPQWEQPIESIHELSKNLYEGDTYEYFREVITTLDLETYHAFLYILREKIHLDWNMFLQVKEGKQQSLLTRYPVAKGKR